MQNKELRNDTYITVLNNIMKIVIFMPVAYNTGKADNPFTFGIERRALNIMRFMLYTL